jgi:D-serine deaminase-like pyridoxal phosphate-dependent protein
MSTQAIDRELERLKGRPGSRYRLPTPALVLDLDALEDNIRLMAERVRNAGLQLRPHAKGHKSAQIARLQIEAGAVGVCCTKLGEAEALMDANIRGVLVTSPIVGGDCAERAAQLAQIDATFQIVVDHPAQVEILAACADRRGVKLRVLIDIDVGLARTGVNSVAAALELARRIRSSPALMPCGVQGYGGHWQHLPGLEARRAAVAAGMQRLRAVIDALAAQGAAPQIVTGGGTGTFAADAKLKILNEVQPGSYIFMDAQYRDALGEDPDGAFEQSLFVQSRVVSVNAEAHVTVDAGLKAFATDGPAPRPVGARFTDCRYNYFGDEHGRLSRPLNGAAIDLDQRIEFVPPHCDPTVDRYDRYFLVRKDVFVGATPIEAARRAQ